MSKEKPPSAIKPDKKPVQTNGQIFGFDCLKVCETEIFCPEEIYSNKAGMQIKLLTIKASDNRISVTDDTLNFNLTIDNIIKPAVKIRYQASILVSFLKSFLYIFQLELTNSLTGFSVCIFLL